MIFSGGQGTLGTSSRWLQPLKTLLCVDGTQVHACACHSWEKTQPASNRHLSHWHRFFSGSSSGWRKLINGNKHSCWYKRIRMELRASSASSLSWPGRFLGELMLVIMRKWTTYKVNRFLNTCNITSSSVWIINSVISFNRLHTLSSSVWPSSVHVCPWKSRVWMRQ